MEMCLCSNWVKMQTAWTQANAGRRELGVANFGVRKLGVAEQIRNEESTLQHFLHLAICHLDCNYNVHVLPQRR